MCFESEKHQEKTGNSFVQRPNSFTEERCYYCLNFFQSHMIRLRRVVLQDVNKFIFPSERGTEFNYFCNHFACDNGNSKSLILIKTLKGRVAHWQNIHRRVGIFLRNQIGSLRNSVHIFPTLLRVMRSSISE